MDYTEIPALVPDNVRGIIFDYGGTLDSHGDHWSHIILDGWRHAGLDPDSETFRKAYIHGERALAREDAVSPTDTFLDLMRKKIRAELTDAGLGDDRMRIELIARYCYDSARRCTAEARPVLMQLAESRPLAVVSNFYGNLRAVLSDFGLLDCFSAVIESAEVGVRKPDPAIFRLGLEALGLPAEQVLVVGDSLDKDIAPARTLGCSTLHIPGRTWDSL